MYVSALESSFQDIIATPISRVINPPVLNEIRLGERFAKSFAGLTTLAAIFTESVAIPTPSSERRATRPRTAAEAIKGCDCPASGEAEVSWERMNTGSQSLAGPALVNSD